MNRNQSSFALIDLLAFTAVVAVLLAIGVPSLARARELSKRMTCSVNLAGIGASAKLYANENQGKWPVPPYKRTSPWQIDYLAGDQVMPLGQETPGDVGFKRGAPSTSETVTNPSAGSTALSVTRAFWIMVRSGDINIKQFVCPSSGDNEDPTENLDLYYDFTEYCNVSYGYLVPFGPRDTQPREGMDNRQVLAADKGPFYRPAGNPAPDTPWLGPDCRTPLRVDSSPRDWKQYNSPNHGGWSTGEGQNALYADGHASFLRTPLGGMDSDNIYTVMTNQWGPLPYNRIFGATPHTSQYVNPYPGQGALGSVPGMYSSTDSLIYP